MVNNFAFTDSDNFVWDNSGSYVFSQELYAGITLFIFKFDNEIREF